MSAEPEIHNLNWHPNFKPRKWQLEALALWKLNFKGVVSVVTGGGKTVFAHLCILEFFKKYPEGHIIIVVPTITLLDQWYVSLQEDLGVHQDQIACFSGQEKPASPNMINLVVINTARKVASEITSHISDSFLIIDECHRAGSQENLKALIGFHTATLGLSATPERDYDNAFEEIVSPSLGNIIYTYDYVQALADGVITPFKLVNVRVNFLQNEQDLYDQFTKKIALEIKRIKDKGVSDERLKILLQKRASVSSDAMMRIPVAVKLTEENKGDRTLIFHERVERAENIKQILLSRNHNATIYHSLMGPALRRDNLMLYRRGVFDVLVSCRALDEGLNVPETQVAIIASATASHRQRIQRLGRVLRPYKNKDIANIYTIYITEQEERRLMQESREFEDIASVIWYKGY